MAKTFYIKTTENCQLNCKHCYTEGRSTNRPAWNMEKTLYWIETFIKDLIKPESIHFEFHGGEPLLDGHEKIQEFTRRVKHLVSRRPDIECSFGITSNLVINLKEEIIEFFKEIDGVVGTSYDPEIRFENDLQFNLWKKNIQTLNQHDIQPKLNISFSRATISSTLKELLEPLKELQFREIAFEPITQHGSAVQNHPIFPTNYERSLWHLHAYYEYQKNKTIPISTFDEITDIFEKGVKKGLFHGQCEKHMLTFNPDGTIAGCPNNPKATVGTLNDVPITVIYSNGKLDLVAKEQEYKEVCFNCAVFQYCGSYCYQLDWDSAGHCPAPKELLMSLADKDFNLKDKLAHRKKYFKIIDVKE